MKIRSNLLSIAGAASRFAIILSLLVGGTAGKSEAQELQKAPPRGGRSMQVLFIGNSLTYSNELPLIVQALAKAAGQDIYVEMVAFGGFSLNDHLQEGSARAAIESRRWDVVVMQHGPSSLPSSRVELRGSAKEIAPLIRGVGAKPAFFMVWPELSRSAYFDAVRESYSIAAADVRAMFIPAGEAWRAAWRRDPGAPLYSLDDFHPSDTGSYTAALSIYGMLSGRPPRNLPARLTLANGHVVEVPAALAKILQDAATEANKTYGRPGRR